MCEMQERGGGLGFQRWEVLQKGYGKRRRIEEESSGRESSQGPGPERGFIKSSIYMYIT